MRSAPVVLCYFGDSDKVATYAVLSSRTTHAAPEALECCRLFARMLERALNGKSRGEILQIDAAEFSETRDVALANGSYRHKSRDEIRGTGYCVDSLEAALWCFATTQTFEDAVLTAANLGDDADTTAAIVGQVAGAFYGMTMIPQAWLEVLHGADDIADIARKVKTEVTTR